MKSKSVKRMLAALLSAALCISLAACGQKENEPVDKETSKQEEPAEKNQEKEAADENAAEEAENEEIPVITIALKENAETGYGHDNTCIAWLEENVGVSLEFMFLPADATEAETKLNLMLANGDYPDVISYQMNKGRMVALGEEGIFIPINDLYEEHSVYLKEIYEKNPDLYANAFAPDGNMYGFVNPQQTFHTASQSKLYYNSDWFESLGLELPTTTEEFKELLIAVKNSDFNGNGEKDEVPLVGRDQEGGKLQYTLMNYFIPCNNTTLLYAKDGEVIFAPDKEEFKMGLEYMKDLYDNGLIDPSSFTNDREQEQALFRSDDKRVFGFVGEHFGQVIDLGNEYHFNVIAAMPPVKSETGAGYQIEKAYVDHSEFSWFITDNCENPEKAFLVADLLLSEEGTLRSNYGLEGKGWFTKDPVPSGIEGVDAIWQTGIVYDGQTNDTLPNVLFRGTEEFRAKMSSFIQSEEDKKNGTKSFEYRLYEEASKLTDYFYPEYLPLALFIKDSADRETYNNLQVSLKGYVDSAMARFITGELDLEKDWDSYVSDIQQYGVDEYVRIYQEAYTEYLSH